MTLHWQQFTRNDQLLAISAEIVRASIWEQKDREKFVGALERGVKEHGLERDAKQRDVALPEGQR